MGTDLNFFTNERGASLADRFTQTLKAVKYFDVLAGYFRHRLGYHSSTISIILIMYEIFT